MDMFLSLGTVMANGHLGLVWRLKRERTFNKQNLLIYKRKSYFVLLEMLFQINILKFIEEEGAVM